MSEPLTDAALGRHIRSEAGGASYCLRCMGEEQCPDKEALTAAKDTIDALEAKLRDSEAARVLAEEQVGVIETSFGAMEESRDEALAEKEQMRESLTGLIGCIKSSASEPTSGIGGHINAACRVIMKTTQFINAQDALGDTHR